MKLVRCLLVLCAVLVAVSACSLSKKWVKYDDQKLEATLKKQDDSFLCHVNEERRFGKTPRFWRFMDAELERRNLGDCSWAHKECVKIGLEYKSEHYIQCRIGMATRPVISGPTPWERWRQQNKTTNCRSYWDGIAWQTRCK